MKKKLKIVMIIFCSFMLSKNAMAQLDTKLTIYNENGTIALAHLLPSSNISVNNAAVFLKTILANGNASYEFELKTDLTDNLNLRHLKFKEKFNGVGVTNGEYNVHCKNGFIESINGIFVTMANRNMIPILTESQALQFALADINAQTYAWQNPASESAIKINSNNPNATYYPTADLSIMPNGMLNNTSDILIYTFKIFADSPNLALDVRVNADNGSIVSKSEARPTAIANVGTYYYGNRDIDVQSTGNKQYLKSMVGATSYETQNSNYQLFSTDITDVNWANFALTHKPALDAHWATERTLTYFLTKHNRASYDNANHPLRSVLCSCWTSYSNGTMWIDEFGLIKPSQNNSGAIVENIAHEFGHGINSTTAKLQYDNKTEWGGMNESLSDIWGACVKHFADPTSNVWLVGDLAVITDLERNMQFPKQSRPINENSSCQWTADCYKSPKWYDMLALYGDVHAISGIMNKWFFLITEGETDYNDLKNYYNVRGLGFEKSAKIVYKMETTGLNAYSKFMDARNASILAARQLNGGVIGSQDEITVTNAWYAVGVGESYKFGPSCSNGSPTILTGNMLINTSATPLIFNGGEYYIPENIGVYGDVTFNNATIYVENAKKITLDLSLLSLNGTRITTCNGRWKGFELTRASMLKTDQFSNKSTIIENAEDAIYKDDQNIGSGLPHKVLDLSNTVFNKNNRSIVLLNYTKEPFNNTIYPFSIKNCIFTCRNIPVDINGNYDNINTIRGGLPSFPNIFEAYEAPFINNTNYLSNATNSYLNNYLDDVTTLKPEIGIELENVHDGDNNPNGVGGIVIGSNIIGSDINIFDNLNKGMFITNSNATVSNCVFQNSTVNGVGIEASKKPIPRFFDRYPCALTSAPPAPFNANRKIVINGIPSNSFYNVSSAINICAKSIDINNCFIASNQNSTTYSPNGWAGITVGGGIAEINEIKISNNKIYNIRNAILGQFGATNGSVNLNKLDILDNDISNDIPSIPLTNSFVNQAIAVNATGYPNDEVNNTATPPINILNNNLIGVYNGIKGSFWNGKPINIIGNTITLNVNAGLFAHARQQGIKLEGCRGGSYNPQGTGNVNGNRNDNIVRDNNITGATMAFKNVGIELQLTSNTTIECNNVSSTSDGYRFDGACPSTKFTDNFIATNNKNGLSLYNGAAIGKQGNEANTTATSFDICTSNNDWGNDANWWFNQVPKQYMIYTDASDPINSELVVRGNGKFNPDGGCYAVLGQNQLYSSTNGLVLATGPDGSNCTRCTGAPTRIKRTVAQLLEEIANGTITIPNDEANKRLDVMQQQLYDLVQTHPEIASGSFDIQQFIYNNQWNNVDFIYFVGYFAARNNWDVVDDLMTYWSPGTNSLGNNYYQYFDWLTKMHQNTQYQPPLNDVLALANKCPSKEGTIVYAARNLYRALSNKNEYNFADDCDGNAQARGVKKATQMIRLNQPKVKPVVAEASKLLIYPNPTTGTFVVKNNANKVNKIELIDALGKIVKVFENLNTNTFTISNVGLLKGLYALKVTSQNKTISTQKLIVE